MQKYAGVLGDLHRAYARLVGQWPVDRLRPTHCYKKVLAQHMDAQFERLAALQGAALAPELERVRREIAALQDLAANTYRTQHRLSATVTNPASHPGYYTKLLDSIDSAAASGKKLSLRVD
ncbi:hypothetical protein H4R21_004804 [Coemansia helicoidea]|uniref:Uncharacterized protein n=1 Tax=Coemansia helicoidea TaxID=1286919 RepID=A0ACC1KWD3_9FUNG|nr:hypothetical protein H4R21_004804 [Coemansia helicoidea]